jgi:serine/threonine protein kinase
MEEPLQKSLERYDVLDRIAVGGMAEVFLAKAYGAHGFEKTIAIKRILPELARDPEFAARFIAEAKVAVKLSHANVVQVFDFGRIGESLFIAMEYVDGLDLALFLRKFKDEGRMVPLPAALHIGIEIMRALDFAHQHNVVHRDVSPSNILISRAGEVKIADFGIAVASSPNRAGGGGTGPRKVMGKWRYMSPEQTRGDSLDTRSDLFSAASVLFELFTGQKLFPGDEAEEIIKNIETMPIPKANSIRPGVPHRLDEILAGPLSRKPIDRPPRPAVVLRSLIELSYESSIMATALDVSEAVAAVLPPKRSSGPGVLLDDVIRKQLGAAHDKSVARRTAVTDGKPPTTETAERATLQRDNEPQTSTGLMRKLSQDGIASLEEIEPTHAANPRSKRATGELAALQDLGEPPSSPDSAMHRLLDARVDPDRRTEVGGPPTGQIPRDSVLELPGGNPPTSTTPPKRPAIADPMAGTSTPTSRAAIWIVLVILLLAGGGIAAWQLSKSDPPTRVVTPAGDASINEAIEWGTVEIDPDPEGATGFISDVAGTVPEGGTFGPTSHKTPVRKRVEANKPFRVHIELEGYEPYDKERTVKPNETLSISPTLNKARAILIVNTTPQGAQVSLGGVILGVTPLTRKDLEANPSAELVITRAGFEPIRQKIALTAGKPTEVTQTLKAGQRYGAVKILVPNGWGDVYLKGTKTKLGRAPNVIRAPVGRQTFHLVNTGRSPSVEWDVTCEVSETDEKICSTQMP